ncbi:MAG TPA: hypothetical protein VEI83_01580 [Acidimicrobiales bacterium]|nr:hypothetical protein [Acidimicrobiales bacterium]
MADEKPEADVAEQAEAPTGGSPGEVHEAPDTGADRPEADVLEQSIVVEEDQVPSPAGSRATASEGDWLEQSIEVPSEAEEDRR